MHAKQPLWKEEWESTQRHFEGWWAQNDAVLTFTGLPPLAEPRDHVEPPDEPSSHIVRFTDPTWFAQNEHHRLSRERFPADTLPIAHVDYGCVQLAAVLGAEPDFDSETIWYAPLGAEPGDYAVLNLRGTEKWWRVHKRVMERVLERSGGNYLVGAPAFGSNLDVLAALRGSQALLLDLVDRPEWTACKLSEINDAFSKAFSAYYEQIRLDDGSSAYAYFHIWGHGRVSQVQCDFSAMISPAMFERFVVPSLAAQCGSLDRALYHLDGPDCIRHLDLLLEIPDLHAIQWTPGAGEPGAGDEKWFFIYDRILSAGKSIQALQVSAKQARSLFERFGAAGVYVSVETADLSQVDPLIEFVDALR